jgi:hypothetical protein
MITRSSPLRFVCGLLRRQARVNDLCRSPLAGRTAFARRRGSKANTAFSCAFSTSKPACEACLGARRSSWDNQSGGRSRPAESQQGSRLGFLGWFSGKSGRIPKRNARELMRIAQEGDGLRVDEAILALARLPHSDDILECVASFIPKTGLGPHTSAAIVALGIMRHPRAADYLLKLVALPKSPCRGAGKALGHARNNHAVPGLLNIALTSPNFECARVAVLALEKMGTPDAGAALAKFRAQPGRRVRVSGADGDYWSTTGSLGQLRMQRETPSAPDAGRVIVTCPHRRCARRIRLPVGRKGKVQCPSCKSTFKAAT